MVVKTYLYMNRNGSKIILLVIFMQAVDITWDIRSKIY